MIKGESEKLTHSDEFSIHTLILKFTFEFQLMSIHP